MTRLWKSFKFCEGKICLDYDGSEWTIGEWKMRILRAWTWTPADSVATAVYAAELVLGYFEKEYPDDKRPRMAIEAAKRWLGNPTKDTAGVAEVAAKAAIAAAEASYAAARSVVDATTTGSYATDEVADAVARFAADLAADLTCAAYAATTASYAAEQVTTRPVHTIETVTDVAAKAAVKAAPEEIKVKIDRFVIDRLTKTATVA
jgi:hypothetical protein